MKISQLLLTVSVVLNSLLLAAQEPVDSLKTETLTLTENSQETEIDTINEAWKVRQFGEPELLPEQKIILDTPDSVYISRLKSLNSFIPLTFNDEVKKWILYDLKMKRLPYIIGLSEYYFPFFESILEEQGMPHEFKYLPIIESALNPVVASPKRATGLWQFMPGTALFVGLHIDSYIDDRCDPLKSTIAAANYLQTQYNEFGNWDLALAAYDCGPGNVSKAIKRSGGQTDYWELRKKHWKPETKRYVPAYIAAVYVMNYYREHNIVPVKAEIDIETDTIMVNKRLHFIQISEKLNIPIEQLRALNPQYRRDIIPGTSEKSHILRLPYKKSIEFAGIENEIYGYNNSVFFASNFRVLSGTEKTNFKNYDAVSYSPVSLKGKRELTYTVKEGDNFGFIAAWYKVNIADIKNWNGSYSNRLSVGQKLKIYVPIKKYPHYSKINSMTFEQKEASKGAIASSDNTQKSTNTVTTTNIMNDNSYVWYQIQGGDNLWLIAQNYPGITVQDIKKLNGFSNTETKKLQAGQYIKIKRK